MKQVKLVHILLAIGAVAFVLLIVKPSIFSSGPMWLEYIGYVVIVYPFMLFVYVMKGVSESIVRAMHRIDQATGTQLVNNFDVLQQGSLLQILSVAKEAFNVTKYSQEQKKINAYLLEHPHDRSVLRNGNLFLACIFIIGAVFFFTLEFSFPAILLGLICLVPGLYIGGWAYYFWSFKTLQSGRWLRINANMRYVFLAFMMLLAIGCFVMQILVYLIPE